MAIIQILAIECILKISNVRLMPTKISSFFALSFQMKKNGSKDFGIQVTDLSH
jgi:hypothetical protein